MSCDSLNRAEQADKYPGVDVIIPVWKPGRELRTLLIRLLKQTVKPRHILLVNTEEQYFDEELVSGLERITVIHVSKAEFDHGGIRRKAAALLKQPFFLCMTMDALPADRYLIESLLRAFSDENVGAAYARQLPKKDCRPAERIARSFNYGPESCTMTKKDLPRRGIKTYFCSNVCAMYRRSTYEKLGGFVPRTIFNEDMIFAAAVIDSGMAVRYCADARVFHSHNYTGKQQFHRNFDLGVSQAQYSDVFKSVPSEKEGIRLVARLFRELVRTGHPGELPDVCIQSVCKYAGFLLGKNYRKLPEPAVLWCTGNRDYWRKPNE